MKLVPITQGQNLFDVCIQEYGDVSYIFQLLNDNENLELNSNVSAGDQVYIEDGLFGEPVIKAVFQEKKRQGNNPVNYTDFDGGDFNGDFNDDFNISN